MRTIGISPKLIAAIVTAAVAYLLGQTILELPPVAVIALQLVAIGVGVYSASPGAVTETPQEDATASLGDPEPTV